MTNKCFYSNFVPCMFTKSCLIFLLGLCITSYFWFVWAEEHFGYLKFDILHFTFGGFLIGLIIFSYGFYGCCNAVNFSV